MPHTLTVTCYLGLCNRLRVLLSGKVIARATRRDFAMLWLPTVGCSAGFGELFQNDWNVRDDVPSDPYTWLDGTRIPFHLFPDLPASPETHLAVEANGWMLRPTLYPAHVELERQARALTNELAPVPAIEQQVEIFCEQNFRDTMIGVHLRRGDFVRWHPDTVGNLDATFQVVDHWLDGAPSSGILVCTDDGAPVPYNGNATTPEGIVLQFVRRYGGRVVAPKTTTLDRREPKAIQEAVRDLWLLRRTRYFVGTVGSSFSEIAAAGRDIPATLTAHPTPRYTREIRWLKRLGVAPLLARAAHAEFGKPVPHLHVMTRYLGRIPFVRARWTRKLRRTK